VILVDVVLGHVAAPDPAGDLAGPIREAHARGVAVLAHVCGTKADPQRLGAQARKLEEAGAVVYPTSAAAAEAACALVEGRAR
jgi:FdrA protein